MYDRRRIAISKWTGIIFAVVLLSQSIARWRSFFAGPDWATYAGVTLVVTLFLLIILALGAVVFAEEKNKGNAHLRQSPFFERLADRMFLIRTNSERVSK